MGEERKNEVYLAALAGLLHDVGKFAQRARASGKHTTISARLLEQNQLLETLIPPEWEADVGDAIAYHHGGDTHKMLTQVVRTADWLAASERSQAPQTKGQPEPTPLIPLPALVALVPSSADNVPMTAWGYPLNVVDEVCFPQSEVRLDGYPELWGIFTERLKALPKPINTFARMQGLLDALARTTAYIPSATPWETDELERTVADVPLLQHAHLTAALAVCLMHLGPESVATLHRAGRGIAQVATPIAQLIRADFSGIQDFIYRITEVSADRSFRNTAKRLRARSLHLALLNRAVGEWLLERMGLPPTQLLYASGGVIEWLLPLDADFETPLRELEHALWTEKVFGGTLGVVWADARLLSGDFANVKTARERLETALGTAKDRKAERLMIEPEFFKPEKIYHVCQVCELTSMAEENQTCALCDKHEVAGGALPKTFALAQGVVRLGTPLQPKDLMSPLNQIGERLKLLNRDELAALRSESWEGDLLLRGVNAFPKDMPRPDVIPGRWNVATAAPILDERVLDFEEIANLSQGAPLLGVLKADADRMGLLFSRGIHPPTFSRTMALSATIHRFFGEYLDQLCHTMTGQWKSAACQDEALQEALKRRKVQEWENLKSIFYVLYAGGDDLFIIGPWDAMIDLALELRRQYRAYTCKNPEFGLSAGLIFIKPHMPIHQFSKMADEAERAAKNAGRDRIKLLGQELTWAHADAMIAQGKLWAAEVNNNSIPRGLLHDLGRLIPGDITAEMTPLFIPTLYYTLVRRLRNCDQAKVETLGKTLIGQQPQILVALEYATLTTRKE